MMILFDLVDPAKRDEEAATAAVLSVVSLPAASLAAGSPRLTYLSPRLVELDRAAREYQERRVEPSLQQAYDSLFKGYRAFCMAEDLEPYDPATVRLYLVDRVDASEPKSTLRSRLAAIRCTSHGDGAADPTINHAAIILKEEAAMIMALAFSRTYPSDSKIIKC